MVNFRMGLLALLVAFTALSATPVSLAQSGETAPYAANQVLVSLQPGYRLSSFGRLYDSLHRELRAGLYPGVMAAEMLDSRGSNVLVHLREGSDVESAVAALRGNPAVRLAEPNYVRTIQRTPNDPIYGQQWALRKIQATEAWDISVGSEHVVIAVLDTGVSPDHEDLQGRLVGGYDAIDNHGNQRDVEGHGTFVSGIIASAGDNGKGIAGVCWQCRIMPIRVGDADGYVYADAVLRGIYFAADNGARIVNMSFGGPDHAQIEQEAMNYAHSKGVLLIAASGNDGTRSNFISYPAAYDHVLAVAATTNSDQATGFSSYGPHVDIAAPGAGIWSTSWSNGRNSYGNANGTSFSSPHVAGVAGLVLSIWPELSPDHLGQILMGSSDDIGTAGRDDYNGFGRVNALRAATAARDRVIPEIQQPVQHHPAFARVAQPADPSVSFFAETGHTLRGAFKAFWEQNGGLAVFGFPISEEFTETTAEGTYIVQYFERERFEYHPENTPPYHVLLGRLGDSILQDQGRNWFDFPKGQQVNGCRHFAESGHTICEPFLSYWRSHGLQFDGQPGFGEAESLALFGLPLSEPQMETNSSGDTVLTQWFERARFEYHPNNGPQHQVLLGLLGNELVDRRAWR